MWHEARRQERKIRGMLVDYRRRAERRRDFYEKIKADPTQFLQVHGRQCKIHLDPTVAAAADAAVMMPWQGQGDNLIDRFDVRAHLDIIPNPPRRRKGDDGDEDLADDDGAAEGTDEGEEEERHLNYERYRIIAQNSFLGVSEEKFLRQLHLEEQFGYASDVKGKRSAGGGGGGGGGVAIGYSYDEGGSGGGGGTTVTAGDQHHESEGEESDSDLDVDLAINVSKMDPTQAHEMNAHGRRFGMSSNDFYSFLTNDLEEWESFKLAKEEEQEKALFSGRRSRRERRYHREKRLANRKISPPSYAAQASPSLANLRESKSASRSPTPENSGKITYITSFGDDEEPASSANTKPTYADKVKCGKTNKIEDKRGNRSRRSRSRSPRSRRKRSRSRSRSKRSKSRRRSRSRRSRSKRRSRSRSRKRFRRSRSRSGSRYKSYRRKRSTSSSSKSSASSRKSVIAPPGTVPHEIPRRSPLKMKEKEKSPPVDAPKVIPRYYGRKKSDYSSSDLTSDGDGTEEAKQPTYKTLLNDSKSGNGNDSGTSTKYKAISSPSAMNTINVATTSSANMTVIERLKRKRQALLNRQFKADKMAEQLKTEREKQEQQTREDELREMAIRLRRRQRELRHAYDSRSSSSSSSSSSDSSSSSSSRASSAAKPTSNSSKYTSYSSRRSRSRERSRNSREPERRSTIGPRDRRRDEEKGNGRGSERREKRLVDY